MSVPEHNTMIWPGLKPGPVNLESNTHTSGPLSFAMWKTALEIGSFSAFLIGVLLLPLVSSSCFIFEISLTEEFVTYGILHINNFFVSQISRKLHGFLINYYACKCENSRAMQTKFVVTSVDKLNWADKFMFYTFFQWPIIERFQLRVLQPFVANWEFKLKLSLDSSLAWLQN